MPSAHYVADHDLGEPMLTIQIEGKEISQVFGRFEKQSPCVFSARHATEPRVSPGYLLADVSYTRISHDLPAVAGCKRHPA